MSFRIAFVGFALSEHQLSSHPAASVAGNRYQTGLLRALGRCGHSIDAITVAPNAMWRGAGRVCAHRRTSELSEDVRITTVPYLNLLLIKQGCVALGVLAELAWWVWRTRGSRNRALLAYNTISFVAGPAFLIAKLTGVPLVVIVADVPISAELRSKLRRLEARAEVRLIRAATGLIGLTQHTGEDLGGGVPSLVIEGGWDPSRSASLPLESLVRDQHPADPRRFVIVYAGALNSVSGIELAVSAVGDVDYPNVELHIYGSGDLADWVAAKSAERPERFIFYGSVTHEEAQAAELSADLLICPRIPDGYVTRYTFPSKLIEYMAVGVPTMCNLLEGLPEEYRARTIVPAEPEARAWTQSIQDVIEDRSGMYSQIGHAGALFIRTEKTWDVAASRLSDFLEEIAMPHE